MSSPYIEYKSFREWQVVEKAITELAKNNDVKITTGLDYIIGFITKQVKDNASQTHPLYAILEKLDFAKIHYRLERYRDDTIMICVTVVGSRIEIEVFSDGSVVTATFKGDESLEDGLEIVNKIISKNRD